MLSNKVSRLESEKKKKNKDIIVNKMDFRHIINIITRKAGKYGI